MERSETVLTDGIKRFLEHAIGLKEKEPEIFDEMVADCAFSIQIREAT